MKQLNWQDELLGKKITPEDSAGWIIEGTSNWWPGEWRTVIRYERGVMNGIRTRPAESGLSYGWCRPIYPPAGWNGKSETEIWDAMKSNRCRLHISDDVEVALKGSAFYGHGEIVLPAEDAMSFDVTGAAALILALQNAMLLSKRLTQT